MCHLICRSFSKWGEKKKTKTSEGFERLSLIPELGHGATLLGDDLYHLLTLWFEASLLISDKSYHLSCWDDYMTPFKVPSSCVDTEKVIWYLFFLPIPSLLRYGMLRSPAHWRMAIGGREILLCLCAFARAGLSAWNAPSPWEGSFKAQLWWDYFFGGVSPTW